VEGLSIRMRRLMPLTGWFMYIAGIITFGSLGMLRPSVTAHDVERDPGPQLSIA